VKVEIVDYQHLEPDRLLYEVEHLENLIERPGDRISPYPKVGETERAPFGAP
jgi:hypothetical protein